MAPWRRHDAAAAPRRRRRKRARETAPSTQVARRFLKTEPKITKTTRRGRGGVRGGFDGNGRGLLGRRRRGGTRGRGPGRRLGRAGEGRRVLRGLAGRAGRGGHGAVERRRDGGVRGRVARSTGLYRRGSEGARGGGALGGRRAAVLLRAGERRAGVRRAGRRDDRARRARGAPLDDVARRRPGRYRPNAAAPSRCFLCAWRVNGDFRRAVGYRGVAATQSTAADNREERAHRTGAGPRSSRDGSRHRHGARRGYSEGKRRLHAIS